MTVFTWGGDLQLYNTLQSIKFFCNDTFYLQAIIFLGAVVTSFIMQLKFSADPIKSLIRNILIALVIIQLFLVPSNKDLLIEDVVKNTTRNVSNVPYGYAVLLSLLSQAEYSLTQMIELSFSTPNSLRINETGLGFGMIAHLKSMEAMTINDDVLESFGLYYYNCLRPELYTKGKIFEQISTSDDILTALEPTVAFETLVYENGVSTQLSCSEALAFLKPKIDLEAYKYLVNNLSAQLGMNSAKVEGALGDMNSVLYGVSRTAKDTLTQAMMRNLLNYGEIESAKLIGADVATSTYAAVQARMQTRNSWQVAGKQAVENLPMLRIIYYNLVIGVFLFLAIFSAITAQYKYIGLGIGILLSITLWSPIGTLMNSFYYSEMEQFISGLSYLGDFLTIQKIDPISEKTSTMLAIMSNLYTYIPIIAMAIVTGSFMGINAMATTTGANANGIGGEVTKGNIDVGHTRIGNATINSIDVAGQNGYYGNKETGMTSLTSQERTENGLTYTQKDLNDKNNTIASQSSMGEVTASSGGLNSVKSHFVDSRLEAVNTASNEKVNTASTTASEVISNSLLQQLAHSQGANTVDTISNSTGVSKETAQTIEQSRVKSFEKAMTESLSEEERAAVEKSLQAKAGVNFRSGENVLGWLAEKATGVSVGANAGFEYKDVDGNSKTISLSTQTAEKIQDSYKENFAQSLKENHTAMNDISKSVNSGTTHLSQEAVNATNDYQKAVKEDKTHKEAMQNAQSRGYDLTTQIVEQAVKIANPNFDNYSSAEKVDLTQAYLYDISKGENGALNAFKTAENIVVSNYADRMKNDIEAPQNNVKTDVGNIDLETKLDKAGLNEFKENNSLKGDENKFSTQNIENAKDKINANTKSDFLDSLKELMRADATSTRDVTQVDLYNQSSVSAQAQEISSVAPLNQTVPEATNATSTRDVTQVDLYNQSSVSAQAQETNQDIKSLKNDIEDLNDLIEKNNAATKINSLKGDEK